MYKKYKKIDYNDTDLSQYSISDLKKIADYSLRQYLLSQQDGYYYFCPLKNRSYSADKMHVAHYIDRQCNNTRYDLDNCHLISAQSNMWDAQIPCEGYKSKHHFDYENWLGQEKVEELIEKSKVIRIFAKEDYIELIEKFRNE